MRELCRVYSIQPALSAVAGLSALGPFAKPEIQLEPKRPHQTARPSVVRIAPRANFPPKAELTIIWFDPASVAGKDTFDETRKPWKQDEQK